MLVLCKKKNNQAIFCLQSNFFPLCSLSFVVECYKTSLSITPDLPFCKDIFRLVYVVFSLSIDSENSLSPNMYMYLATSIAFSPHVYLCHTCVYVHCFFFKMYALICEDCDI
ncbi:hypothetical protein EGW08_006505 [Elysia chlorotica]|uniref:Uncharacterized protein n=1 Tax=Elysia chlorotica TaxID=188477 RepID=A0A3S1A900_ELYCH|nr:hypothetical protein EGW08_006505 [Elysia chlorotica]